MGEAEISLVNIFMEEVTCSTCPVSLEDDSEPKTLVFLVENLADCMLTLDAH